MDIIIVGILMMVMGYLLTCVNTQHNEAQNIGIWIMTVGVTITVTIMLG